MVQDKRDLEVQVPWWTWPIACEQLAALKIAHGGRRVFEPLEEVLRLVWFTVLDSILQP